MCFLKYIYVNFVYNSLFISFSTKSRSSLTLDPTSLLIQEICIFSWIGAHSNHGSTTRWIGGLMHLINLPTITRRFSHICFVNYWLRLLWSSMPIIFTLVKSRGMVLALAKIEQHLGITHWKGHLLPDVCLTPFLQKPP